MPSGARKKNIRKSRIKSNQKPKGQERNIRILITGQSGIKAVKSLTRFQEDFNRIERISKGNNDDILLHIYNIEEELKEIFLLELKHLGETVEDIWDTLLNRPYHKIEEWWQRAFARLKKRISDDEKKLGQHISLITLHSVFYHRRTSEYISCCDLSLIKDLNLTTVITLIDDIYDIYFRLQQPSEMFNQIEDTPRAHVINLYTIQDWREKEILASRIIKKYVDKDTNGMSDRVKFYVLAVKHPFDTLHNLIRNKPTAYLSHPITEVRRLEESDQQEKKNQAKGLRDELVEFTKVLQKSFAIFLPTTIDEFRIQKENDASKELFIPRLKPRWDKNYYASLAHDSLFCCSNFNDDHDLWGSKLNGDNDRLIFDTLLRPLRSRIARQVSTRDYMLVEQSDYLIVFRPIFNGNLSGGVAEENEYYLSVQEQLKIFSEKQKQRKKIFMYSPKRDILKLIERRFMSHFSFLYNRKVFGAKTGTALPDLESFILKSEETEALYKYIISSTSKGEDNRENICVVILNTLKEKWGLNINVKNAKKVFPSREDELSEFSDSEHLPLDGSTTNKQKKAIDVIFFRDFNEKIKQLYNYKESCIFEENEIPYEEFLSNIKMKIQQA